MNRVLVLLFQNSLGKFERIILSNHPFLTKMQDNDPLLDFMIFENEKPGSEVKAGIIPSLTLSNAT